MLGPLALAALATGAGAEAALLGPLWLAALAWTAAGQPRGRAVAAACATATGRPSAAAESRTDDDDGLDEFAIPGTGLLRSGCGDHEDRLLHDDDWR